MKRFPIARARKRTVAVDPDGMNKMEREYANLLDVRVKAGEVASWKFGALNLKLAPRTHYRTDFMVILASGEIELHEVKGYWEDDARLKVKIVAEMFPEFRIIACTKKGKAWSFEVFNE